MRKNTSALFLTAAVFSLAALALAQSADARDRHRPRHGRAEIRGNLAEIRKDRAELRRDVHEFNRDRDALRQAYRRGSSPAEIERLRSEVRQGRHEIFQDRREIRGDYAELRRDLDKYGYDNNRYGHGRYANRGSGWGWWNNDNHRDSGRDDNRYGAWNHDRFDRRGGRFGYD